MRDETDQTLHERLSTSHSPLGSVGTTRTSFEVTTLDDIVDADDGFLSLREAISEANASAGLDTITFADRIRGGTIRLEGRDLEITDDLVIDGDPLDAGAGGIVISGAPVIAPGPMPDFVNTGLLVESAALRLEDATVRDVTGRRPAGIGRTGIEGIDSDLALVRVNVEGNGSDIDGTGVRLDGGTLALIDSTIQDTVSDIGTGLSFATAEVVVLNSRIIGNAAEIGTGIRGGGDLLVWGSTIADNAGTGIEVAGTMTLINSTIGANGETGVDIGADSTASILNTTITGNQSDGLRLGDDVDLQLANSIILGNGLDIASTGSGTVSGTSNIFATANILVPPQPTTTPEQVFAETRAIDGLVAGALADNGGPTQTVALLDDPANPALDSADPVLAPLLDQRGFLRDATPDIGAFELDGLPPNQSPPLPPLAEKVPLPDSEIYGAPLFLLGPAGDAVIGFADEVAAFQSSLGVYLVGPDGTIGATEWVFPQIEHSAPNDTASDKARPGGGPLSPGDSIMLGDLFAPEELAPGPGFGLFLVADGWALNDHAVFESGSLAFRSNGDPGSVTDTTPELAFIAENGHERLVLGDILHTIDAGSPNPLSNTLNPGGTGQVTSGFLDGRLTIAFEDKPLAGDSDRDFNDVLVTVDFVEDSRDAVAESSGRTDAAALDSLVVTETG